MSIFGELMKLATFAAMEFLVEDRRCVVLAGIDVFLAIVSIRSDICELPIEERPPWWAAFSRDLCRFKRLSAPWRWPR
jgi:hypothetical protein